jgi:ketosteroid isomerase-like protein
MTHTDPRAAALITFYEQLRPADLARLDRLYADPCFFKDPFNEVGSRDGVRRIFAHMFETVQSPRFVVHDALVQGDQCFLSWDFHFNAMTVRGASHLRFDASGRVAYHRDYWDAAEELYEKLPVLGSLLRFIKRRLKAT